MFLFPFFIYFNLLMQKCDKISTRITLLKKSKPKWCYSWYFYHKNSHIYETYSYRSLFFLYLNVMNCETFCYNWTLVQVMANELQYNFNFLFVVLYINLITNFYFKTKVQFTVFHWALLVIFLKTSCLVKGNIELLLSS